MTEAAIGDGLFQRGRSWSDFLRRLCLLEVACANQDLNSDMSELSLEEMNDSDLIHTCPSRPAVCCQAAVSREHQRHQAQIPNVLYESSNVPIRHEDSPNDTDTAMPCRKVLCPTRKWFECALSFPSWLLVMTATLHMRYSKKTSLPSANDLDY